MAEATETPHVGGVKHPLDRLSRAALKRRVTMVAGGVVLCIIGVVMAVLHTVELATGWGPSHPIVSVAFFGCAAGCIGTGGLLGFLGYSRSNIETGQVLRALVDAPHLVEEVTYLKMATGHALPSHTHQLRFVVANERTTFNVGESDVEPVPVVCPRSRPARSRDSA